jgi:TonB family protein
MSADDPEVRKADCSGQPVRLSSQAERLGARGRVVVDCVVDAEGHVRVERIVSIDDQALRGSAESSLKNWTCRPATKGGVPGTMRLRIPLEFR